MAAEPEDVQPEPWTPERVAEWNAYYDVYVMLGVLLLVFIASANKITHSSIWAQLRVGQVVAANAAPVLRDVFSYTEQGAAWVNVPWLFDWSHAVVHKAASDLAPGDPSDRLASSARAEQFGAGALVALNALARMLTALALLAVRRAGPGRWWAAVCVALALGTVLSPTGLVLSASPVALGGIAGPGIVGPVTWGLLFLAVEVWLLHRVLNLGRRGSAYALAPLFALWANVDESFLIGLLVLAAAAAGRARPSEGESPQAPGLKALLAVLGVCAAVCLVNPSFASVYRAAAEPFLGLFRPATDVLTFDQLSFFGPGLRKQAGDYWVLLPGYYAVIVAAGLGSFVLNRRQFSLSRFLVFALTAALWGVFVRYGAEFAVVFAAALALNGQEWYQRRYGTAGRVGTGWSLWSVGGRAVTIVLVFACVAKALTGFGMAYGDPRFGFGFDRDDFAFESADFLKAAPIRGNVLNTTVSQGDALLWRAAPDRKTYLDSRQHLFPAEVLNRLQETRRALSDDKTAQWRPLLDRYQISTVMVQPSSSPKTYQTLSQSPNWVPFYDDGAVVLFGRADAPEGDRAYFQAHRLDPETLAFKTEKPTPAADRPPTPVTWLDIVFQTRALSRPQPHTDAARRWLAGAQTAEGGASMPDPARCLLAVREARTALAAKPDDTQAYRLLAAAYRVLMIEETALLAGLKLTPEDAPRVARISARPDLRMTRFRQRATALNYAIQTTPPPKTREARIELHGLNLDLYQLDMSVNSLDLARDRLQAVVDRAAPGDFSAEVRTRFSQDLAQLDEQIKQILDRKSEMETEQQLSPLQLANFEVNQGAPGLAIHELEEAERTGANPALVKPQLLDLYCDTGQPEKAIEMLGSGSIEDPTFGTEPGVSALRQGRVYFLLGNTENAATLWEKYAIPRLRHDRVNRALGSTQAFLKGQVREATGEYLGIPEKITQQANWEFETGLCRLEGGDPERAAEHFTKALTLAPRLNTRPIVAYYLEKLGKPVPAVPAAAKDEDKAAPKAENDKDGETKVEEKATKSGKPKDEPDAEKAKDAKSPETKRDDTEKKDDPPK